MERERQIGTYHNQIYRQFSRLLCDRLDAARRPKVNASGPTWVAAHHVERPQTRALHHAPRERSLSAAMSYQQDIHVRPLSVPKVSHTGHHHRDAGRVRRCNDLFVTDRTAGLNHRRHTRFDRCLYTVRKWEERIGREHAPG